jgi:hypothetical protein
MRTILGRMLAITLMIAATALAVRASTATLVDRASTTTPAAQDATTRSSMPAGDDAAVTAYRQGDLAGARAEWLAELDDQNAPQGPERGRILYDLGNVAFRSGKILEAVGWYTSALNYRPRDGDTWANLEEARSKAHLEPADRGDLSSTLRRVVRAFTPGESRWIALFGFAACAGALAFEALRGGRLGRWIAIAGLGVAIVACVPWIDGAMRSRRDPLLVIENDRASVFSEPREKANVVAELPAGSETQRVDELPDWVKVRTDSGTEGWVKQGSVFALRR